MEHPSGPEACRTLSQTPSRAPAPSIGSRIGVANCPKRHGGARYEDILARCILTRAAIGFSCYSEVVAAMIQWAQPATASQKWYAPRRATAAVAVSPRASLATSLLACADFAGCCRRAASQCSSHTYTDGTLFLHNAPLRCPPMLYRAAQPASVLTPCKAAACQPVASAANAAACHDAVPKAAGSLPSLPGFRMS